MPEEHRTSNTEQESTMASATLPTFQQPLDLSAEAVADNTRNQQRANLSREEFMSIMIAELRHQDPMEPMSNSELLGQMSQMEQLNASTRTADGIDNLIHSLKFQQLTIASTFIGTIVKAKDPSGQDIQGLVGRVTVSGNNVKLGLQIPVTDTAGNVLLDQEGNPITREITVDLSSVSQVLSPGLAEYTSTIIDENAPPAEEESGEQETETPETGNETQEGTTNEGSTEQENQG
jgi:flagellar hook assembly protein FlgD